MQEFIAIGIYKKAYERFHIMANSKEEAKEKALFTGMENPSIFSIDCVNRCESIFY